MTWPATQLSAGEAFSTINRTALTARAQAQAFSAKSAAGPVSRIEVLELQRTIAGAAARLTSLSTTPGLPQYARDQFANPALDPVAEFTAMRAAMISLRDWIFANFPRDPTTQAVLTHTYDVDGVASQLTFTSAQLAGLRTQIAAFVATIS